MFTKNQVGCRVWFGFAVAIIFVTFYKYDDIFDNIYSKLNISFDEKMTYVMKNITLIDKHSNRTLREVVGYHIIKNTIMISVVDTGYMEMALNLWETSYKKFNITNYLFICITKESFNYLNRLDYMHAYFYDEVGLEGKSSYYGTAAFKKKTLLRTELSMHILDIGYDVMIVDLDIVFLQNPIPYFSDHDDWDIIAQSEWWWDINVGFYWLKATALVIEMQKRVMKRSLVDSSIEQTLINNIIREMGRLKIKPIPINQFCIACGFFLHPPQSTGEGSQNTCVIFHSICLAGYDTKVYKLKEMHLWVVDTNGYYSSSSNKYITYKTDKVLPSNSNEDKLLTLVLNIGQKLERSVILPKFHCGKTICNYLDKFGDVHKLESKFGGLYRENSFLSHPKVPAAVKSSRTPLVSIDFSEGKENGNQFNILVDPALLNSEVPTIISRKIAKFQLEKYHILQLHFK